jgi:small conductance mechanosensitive channel
MAINELIVDFYSTILGGPFANLVVAVIILLLGFIIGRIGGRVVKRVLQEIDLDKNAKKAGIKFSIENFSGSLSAYLIYFISIVAALNQFKVVTPVFMILVVGLVIFLVITALLAVKDFVPNMFSGLYIFRTDFIKNGDKIRMKNLTGIVQEVTLTKTKIKTNSGDLVFIPNSVIVKKQIVKLK